MGLTSGLAGLAARRPRVLVVGVPGHEFGRMRAEAAIVARGWVLAASPAEADVLLTVGLPADELAARIDQVWEQVPRPRHRVDLADPAELTDALAAAQQALRDGGDPEPVEGASLPGGGADHHASHDLHSGAHEMGGMDHESHDMDHGAHDPGGTSHGSHEMDHGAHGMGAMDHGSMAMSGPGGIPLAGGFEGDRDGLEMDVLHLRLGPVLTDWPAGLALSATLSGDVVVDATARLLPAAAPAGPDPLPAAVRASVARLDRAQVLLRLAGWDAVAARTLRLRDALLSGTPLTDLASSIERVRGRVAASRLLAWNLRSAAPSTAGDDDADAIRRRLLGWLDAAAVGDASEHRETPMRPDELAATLQGRTLAAARMLVAAAAVTEAGSVLHA